MNKSAHVMYQSFHVVIIFVLNAFNAPLCARFPVFWQLLSALPSLSCLSFVSSVAPVVRSSFLQLPTLSLFRLTGM